jgi:hypothetical protein
MKLNWISNSFSLVVVAGLAAFTLSSHAQSATATISDVEVSGSYDYTIALKNTGSYNLNGFWYGWTANLGNDLPSNPSSAGNLSGWGNILDGNSIMWANSTGTALAPGQTGIFTFVSTSAPSAITSLPSGESVAYVGGIDFSQGVTGDSTGVFYPTVAAVPEPSTLVLMAVGALGFASTIRRKFLGQ